MQLSAMVSEHTHQVNVIRWFDLRYKEYSGRLFAIPNGGQRNMLVAKKLKAEGVRPGVPDLFLPVPKNGFSGLFIEMKKVKGRITAEQSDWLLFLGENGYRSCVCFGFDEAIEIIQDYLK